MGVPVIGCECEVCQSSDPRDNRLRTSLLVESETTQLVIDSGPDFRAQMLKHQVNRLDALLFTHEHKDHTAGLDDIRAYNFILRRPVQIYASERVEQAIRHDFHYAFAPVKYPGVPELKFSRIGSEAFTIGDIEVQPFEVMHHKLSVHGFKFGDFVYITDANHIPDETWEFIKNPKVLVLNALRKTDHISHFTLDEAIEIAQKLGAEQCYLLHISHQMGQHESVSRELPKGIQLAHDGLSIQID